MAVSGPAPSPLRTASLAWVFPLLLLCGAYGLLGLTLTKRLTHADVMQRCVLVVPTLARIWSVAHIEIGLAYIGIFGGMAWYIWRAGRTDRTHLVDLSLGFTYLLFSFLLDFICVNLFKPFVALLIGDAVVMTFTLLVSRQLWFQRLLGIFVPLVFFTCAFGHFMEGLSYWKLTYPVNVPWTMVTADIGFAILVNTARFPAFIRGEDLTTEMERMRAEAAVRHAFFRDVILSATDQRLHLCDTEGDLPGPLPQIGDSLSLTRETMRAVRVRAVEAAAARHFSASQINALQTAIGEATMNAVVHGGGGEATIRANEDTVQVWICDHGTGIQLSQLPRATLERGFSTKDSLGHGFWLMLHTVGRVDLLTSSSGTIVVITMSRDDAPRL